ncbi:MAG: right-handed parallel beta-helix repeat-containing protein [Kiritimatiellia bacterium]
MISRVKALVLSMVFLSGTGVALAATVHVRANAAAPAAPYDSWANACGDVATAVSYAAANGADTVLVTNGTYSLSSTISIADAIALRSVEGAGATILDGQGQVRVLAVSHPDAVVSGFTVTNGWVAAGDHGGGVRLDDGIVERCIVTACTAAEGFGGGIFIGNGLVDGCIVVRCRALGGNGGSGAGGGIAAYGGAVRSCLVAANECTGVQGHIGGGGIFAMYTPTIENCTIVRNLDLENASNDGCGGLFIGCDRANPVIRNCIIRDNAALGVNLNHDWYLYPGQGSTYRASFNNAPVALGSDAIPGDPLFLSPGSGSGIAAVPGDCHLPLRSPCARTASLQPWMATARDADGLARIAPTTSSPDLGAFTVDIGDLGCAFSASPARGMVPLAVSFASRVEGTDLEHAQLTYRWDFDNDGAYDSEGASSSASWTYASAGTFSPRLRVENATNGASGESVATDAVVVAPDTLYVSPDGSGTPPYDTLATATPSLSTAVAAAADGMTILVDSGVYPLDATLDVSIGVTIRSIDKAHPAVLDGQGVRRCVSLSHDSAVLDGLVISNGYSALERSTGCGVQLFGGTVRDCTVTACNGIGTWGTGIYVRDGLVYRTQITGNRSTGTYAAGGGAFIEGTATLRGCLVAGNYCAGTQAHLGGGGVFLADGGIIENCTIVGNVDAGTVEADGGGGLYFYNNGNASVSCVTNSIVYGNFVPNCAAGPEWYQRANANVSAGFNCTSPALGDDCITQAPLFTDAAAGDYSLQSASPCAFSGENLAWMEGEADIAGNPRIDAIAGRTDIGAYASIAGALACSYTVGYTPRAVPLVVSFAAKTFGTATNSPTYYWDFDGDGATDRSGTDCASTTFTYTTAGVFSPVLVVTNASPFAEAAAISPDCVIASPAIAYVSPDGTDISPYDTPAKAATTIAAALAVAGAGTEVSVAAGRYEISLPILLDKAITLRGAGRNATAIDGGNATRVLEIRDADAICEGVSLVNGRVRGGGAGAILHAGTLRDCIVSNGYAECTDGGGGGEGGGGLMFPDGSTAIAENCTIVRNTSTAIGGGVEIINTGTLRNCLVAANDCGGGQGHVGGGGVLALFGATLENCMIVGNHDGGSGEGGGFYLFQGRPTLTNCILYGNTRADGAADLFQWNNGHDSVVGHCFVGTGYGDALSGDPLLRNVGGIPGLDYDFADCRPSPSSPCVNSGTPLSWMDGATDLDGNPRAVGTPDMGCYELPAVGTLLLLR